MIQYLKSAGVVQWLVCKPSKLETRVRFSPPAPNKTPVRKEGHFIWSELKLNSRLD